MRKRFAFLLLLSLSAGGSLLSQNVRSAAVAGQFYDSNPKILAERINSFLDKAETVHPKNSSSLRALIVPHAGYSCSGAVAAEAYKQVEGLGYKTVVIIGTNHSGEVRGGSVYPEGGYATPLGIAQIDAPLARTIAKECGFGFSPAAHRAEHSVEVQVPFIQTVLPEAKIVPVLMGSPTNATVRALANGLADILKDKENLVVISTDLSHYFPKQEANAVDANTLTLVQNFDAQTLLRQLQDGENIMCGGAGVAAVLLYAKESRSSSLEILDYADSSMSCGPSTEVVGYMAAALYTENPSQESELTADEKKELLRLARTSIKNYLRKKHGAPYSPESAGLLLERGAFVTLKKDGALRGCIGYASPVAPLYQTIIQASVFAAVKDPRFEPVTLNELRNIEIEISVLSPLQKISNPLLVEVGKHGLYITQGNRSGLLLPQVPVENGWDRLTFLEQIGLKAGLSKDAWKSGAELYIFQASVFQE